jgi:GTP-binding protein
LKIKTVDFLCSSPSLKNCPLTDVPEFAFIGRSNVGKSSLINLLAGRKGVAKVSGTPGKTRSINHFRITCSLPDHSASEWYLVDLPGYGYAKLPKTERERFEGMIKSYLQKRENLALIFLLIDSRLEPQPNDVELIRWLGRNELGFYIIFTKTDKNSMGETSDSISRWKALLSKEWAELPGMIASSSSHGQGREEILGVIGNALMEIRRL